MTSLIKRINTLEAKNVEDEKVIKAVINLLTEYLFHKKVQSGLSESEIENLELIKDYAGKLRE